MMPTTIHLHKFLPMHWMKSLMNRMNWMMNTVPSSVYNFYLSILVFLFLKDTDLLVHIRCHSVRSSDTLSYKSPLSHNLVNKVLLLYICQYKMEAGNNSCDSNILHFLPRLDFHILRLHYILDEIVCIDLKLIK